MRAAFSAIEGKGRALCKITIQCAANNLPTTFTGLRIGTCCGKRAPLLYHVRVVCELLNAMNTISAHSPYNFEWEVFMGIVFFHRSNVDFHFHTIRLHRTYSAIEITNGVNARQKDK
jgi:hypothetical protein